MLNMLNFFIRLPINLVFLYFVMLIFILDVIKNILIFIEKRNVPLDQSCEYLIFWGEKQDCNHRLHRQDFINNGNSCDACWGKSVKITDLEAEIRVIKGNKWKFILILAANYSKGILPYISFLYSLIIAFFVST